MALLIIYDEPGGSREVKIDKDKILIGRREDNDIVLSDIFVSRSHATIVKKGGEYTIEDNRSTYGTFVNGRKINKAILRYGDEIRIGNTIIAFIDEQMVDQVKISPSARFIGPAVDFKSEVEDLKKLARESDESTFIKRLERLTSIFENYEEKITELERSRELTSALYEVSRIINFVFDLRVLLNLIMDIALKITRAARGFVMLYDEANDELRPMVARNMGGELSRETIDISRSIALRALEEKRAIITENACTDERFKEEASVIAYKVRSVIAVPMFSKDLSRLGVIYVDSPIARPCFDDKDSEILSGFASQSALALENARLLENIRREERIRQNLSRFFSPSVVAKIMSEEGQVSLGGEQKVATVLFCDIRGFTALVEKSETKMIVEMLNDFFNRMSEQIFLHDGTLDKYMGDCVMAVFGAPILHKDDAARAVRAALGMKWAVGELKNKWRREKNSELVEGFDVGIGINTGELIAGNIGSEGRLEYTVIGDVVNLASRLEKLALPGQIIISESTYQQVKDEFEVKKLPEVEIKGKSQPVKIYEVLGYRPGLGEPGQELTPPK